MVIAMLQRLVRRIRSERGQTLLEFAFVLPIILVFMLTLVDFGLALDRREVIQHAVREGVRQGAIGMTEDEVIEVVVNQSQGILEAGDITVCYVDGPGGGPSAGRAGSGIRVSASVVYQFTLGSSELLTAFGADPDALSIEMTPSAEGRMESSISGATECS